MPARFANAFCTEPIHPITSGEGARSAGIAQIFGDADIKAAYDNDKTSSVKPRFVVNAEITMIDERARPQQIGTLRAIETLYPRRIAVSERRATRSSVIIAAAGGITLTQPVTRKEKPCCCTRYVG